MTTTALVLLGATALLPLLLAPLGRVWRDPVVPVASAAVLVLSVAAAFAAAAGQPVEGLSAAVAIVGGVAAATTAGSPVVRAVFRVVRHEFLPRRTSVHPVPRGAAPVPPPTAEGRGPPAADDAPQRPETVLRGGAWIGYLERAAVAATLLAGWPEGMALVLGVKGVGRYAELRESNAPEAFIIGTFASLLWAAAVAGTVMLLR